MAKSIPRNSVCPCGSRKKYKKCCYLWIGKIRISFGTKIYAANIPSTPKLRYNDQYQPYKAMKLVGYIDTICGVSNLVFRAKRSSPRSLASTAFALLAPLFIGQNWRNFDEYRRG